jgi:hypothetical protein
VVAGGRVGSLSGITLYGLMEMMISTREYINIFEMAESMEMGNRSSAYAADDMYDDRFDRTVEIKVVGFGEPFNRYDFAERVEDVVGMECLEACGPTARRGFYQLTFENEEDANKFVQQAGDFELKGRRCYVDKVRLQERDRRYRVRVHWVSHYIPNEAITKIFERDRVSKVIAAYEDKCNVDGFKHAYALTRTFIIATKNPENIPYLCEWRFKDLRGKAFFTMPGRDPYCLRCHTVDHINRECKAPFCTKCFKMGHAPAVLCRSNSGL